MRLVFAVYIENIGIFMAHVSGSGHSTYLILACGKSSLAIRGPYTVTVVRTVPDTCLRGGGGVQDIQCSAMDNSHITPLVHVDGEKQDQPTD